MKESASRRKRERPTGSGRPGSMPEVGRSVTLELTPLNWYLLGAAAVVIVAGFVLLSRGAPMPATVLAPVLLVAGYVVLIPLGLIVRGSE